MWHKGDYELLNSTFSSCPAEFDQTMNTYLLKL